MILMYHKVHPDSPTLWWVSVDEFYRQLLEIQHKKIVYLDEYDPRNPDHVVITFDGVYQNVLQYAAPLLKKFNYPFELFLSGDHIGKDNSFDKIDKRTGLATNEPNALFVNEQELKKLVKMGGRLQWHSRSHANLALIEDDKEIKKELTVPKNISKLDSKGFTWFAYPHGEFSEQVLEIIPELFKGAVSVIQGDNSDKYKLNRVTVTNDSSFKKASIGVAIPCYNYGKYLVEAVESVLRQTRPADQIVIIDDGSTDNTKELGQMLVKQYPELISYVRNENNLGIVPTFNKAVGLLKAEYVCLLGADNRFLSNYLEETTKVLDLNDEVGITYTDFLLFGPLAGAMYSNFPKPDRVGKIHDSHYHISFPTFTKKIKDNLSKRNVIHGSSVFRKKAFEEVGGYTKGDQAEDHNLFLRIVNSGWEAQKTSETFLEYRQHSNEQTNTLHISFAQLQFYKSEYSKIKNELDRIHASKFWKLLFLYKHPKQAIKKITIKMVQKISNNIVNKVSSI